MFGRACSIIGMIHLLPLPGSAGYKGSMEEILGAALEDALTYKEEGVDALLIENMHDVPYLNGAVDPETVAAMTVVSNALKYETVMPTGIQVLAGANLDALGIAVAIGAHFIRVEGFVYAHIGDEGIHQSQAAKLLRKRALLKADNVQIFADIKKKHSSHAITQDVSLVETAEAAEFFKADGVVITGSKTGAEANLDEVAAVRKTIAGKVLVGSGVNGGNYRQFAKHADAVIVGSAFKHDGIWSNAVDGQRVKSFMHSVNKHAVSVR